jgi:acyl dehydratase
VIVDEDRIGWSRDSEEFRTNSQRLAQFAESLGDTNPDHRAGRIASPVFHHVPVMQSLVEVLRSVSDGFLIHGEQDFIYHRPIVPGQRLFSRSTLVGIRNSGAGALFLVRSETRTHDGQPVSTQRATCLVQGHNLPRDLGEAHPAKPALARSGTREAVTFPIDERQTWRYAEAARDYSPYTLDSAAARALGLRAAIVHGMCTLALIARAVVDGACAGDTRRMKRLGCRFSHPLYVEPGQQLRAELWPGPTTVAFEAKDRSGNLVVKNGYAEVGS